MLKEKLYLEYQKRYKEYKEKYKKIEILESDIENLQSERERKKDNIESQKKTQLDKLLNKKKELENKFESVKKDGTESSVVKEYSEFKFFEIKRTENELLNLKREKCDEIEALELGKTSTVADLESQKKQCKMRLDDLMNGGEGSSFLKQFDEEKLRKQLTGNMEQEIIKLSAQYDGSVSRIENSLQRIDSEYEEILKRELSYVGNDAYICDMQASLSSKATANELPQVIMNVLNEPVSEVIQRKEINGGMRILELARKVNPLDDLSKYTPKWLKVLVNIGFPTIAGVLLFLIFVFCKVHFGFVEAATNTVANVLFWSFAGAIIGGLVFGITETVWGIGKICGIIGAVLGFWVATNWSITVPDGVTNIIEWILKVIVCLVVGIGFYLLNTCTPIGAMLVQLGMKIDYLKKSALLRQGYAIQENVDSYCALIKYREIIALIVTQKKQEQNAKLVAELQRLQTEKVSAIDNLRNMMSLETEQKISEERDMAEKSKKDYDAKQMNLIQMQDECMIELAGYDGIIQEKNVEFDERIQSTIEGYDKKIADIKDKLQKLKSGLADDKDSLVNSLENDIFQCNIEFQEKTEMFDKKLEECEQEYIEKIKIVNETIERSKKEFSKDLADIHNIFERINNNAVGFDESQGVLSDYLYLYNENSSDDPKTLVTIKHDKKPIVFLYDLEEATNVSASLFEFMKSVLAGFYTINANAAFDAIVTDPVSKARKYEQMTNFLTIENDIKKLSEMIQSSMREVAKKGLHIDEYNRKMALDGEDKIKYFKYKIVNFIVPEEAAAQNTNFFDSDLWGTLGDGNENGFIPIFYISYSDWKNTFDEDSKLNSKFILQLKNAIGSSNGAVYKIDADNITIKKIN